MRSSPSATASRAPAANPGFACPPGAPARSVQAARPPRILVVEDQSEIASLIRLHLEDLPGRVTVVSDGNAGLGEARCGGYHLIVLDVRLPGCDGLQVCQTLRAEGILTPILVASAKGADVDRIVGLELGADDYLAKPFNVAELVARSRALLRRQSYAGREAGGPALVHASDVAIDPAQRRVTVGSRLVELTSTEFDLLYLLASHRGRVFTRAQILEAIWKSPYEGYDHNVNCHINRLRLKIESDPSVPRYIVTVWGVGYKFSG